MLWIIVLIGLILGWLGTSGKKSQLIRLVDIFLIGPLMIYASTLLQDVNTSLLLAFFGATTITYNLRNYMTLL